MEYVLQCPSKINLTLRITGTRKDGMHNIGSLFYKLPSVEKLTFRYIGTDNVRKDIFRVHGQVLDGKNILEAVLETARIRKPELPALEIDLWKEIPPGSGLGSGSGNAAALAKWLFREAGVRFSREEISEMGADVPFLFDGDSLSFRSGTGADAVSVFREPAWRPKVLVVIPRWSSVTRDAYRLADEAFGDPGWACSAEEAFEEGRRIAKSMEIGEEIGLLPNDFVQVLLNAHPEYAELFRIAEKSGAFAWGIGGSGSSFFCLFRGGFPAGVAGGLFARTGMVLKILELE
ncbi:MAG: hypothetical protein Q7I97_05425 [Thermovirgaceae bacterium]|nr:hypothetical protein [Thermovirgaceae bacterium]